MVFFGYHKQKQKALKFAWQHFGIKVHFESKLILIQWLDEENWIKFMYIQYIIYSFSMAIKLHVCGSLNITKLKKIEKKMQCPSIKSPPLWYGNVFFYNIYIIMDLLFKNEKHTHFLNEISFKKFKIFK
jgi:hypothetical protein